jgi:hypothetical protein
MGTNQYKYCGCYILGKDGQVYKIIRKTAAGYHVKQLFGPITWVWQDDLTHSRIRHLGEVISPKDTELLRILYG